MNAFRVQDGAGRLVAYVATRAEAAEAAANVTGATASAVSLIDKALRDLPRFTLWRRKCEARNLYRVFLAQSWPNAERRAEAARYMKASAAAWKASKSEGRS